MKNVKAFLFASLITVGLNVEALDLIRLENHEIPRIDAIERAFNFSSTEDSLPAGEQQIVARIWNEKIIEETTNLDGELYLSLEDQEYQSLDVFRLPVGYVSEITDTGVNIGMIEVDLGDGKKALWAAVTRLYIFYKTYDWDKPGQELLNYRAEIELGYSKYGNIESVKFIGVR